MPRNWSLIKLTTEDEQQLTEQTCKGTMTAGQFKRAMILLEVDEGLTDAQIKMGLNISRRYAESTLKRFAAGGIERALNEISR